MSEASTELFQPSTFEVEATSLKCDKRWFKALQVVELSNYSMKGKRDV